MQLLPLFIFLQLLLLLLLLLFIIKATFPERNSNSPKKFSIREGKNSRSVERSNTYPEVSKAEIKKK